MTKILFASDLHIHNHKKSNERFNDCINVLEWIFKTAEEQNINNIIMLGDLFHSRQAVSVPIYQKTFEIFDRYGGSNPSKNIYLLLGNHDLWHLSRWDVSSVFPLRAFSRVKVIANPCTLMIDDTPISFLPFTIDPIQDLKQIKNDHKIRILCGHLAIDGALLNTLHHTRSEVSIEHDGGVAKINKELFQDWHFVFLGHYHAAQQITSSIEYIGSPLQLSFGEAFQNKHILIFDTETYEKKYICNTFSPQHFIIPEKDLNKYELKNNFIRVIVEDIAAADIVELRNKLVEKEGVSSFDVVQDVKVQEQKQIIEDAKSILLDKSKMVEEYIRHRKEKESLQDLHYDKLIEIWNKIASEEKDGE